MILPKHKVTANDITSIDLARDKTIGHSPTISIPIEGNTKYKVTVSEGKGGKYLRIDITKRTPHTVTYEFSGDHPGNQYLPASEQATATTKVTLPTVTTPITGTLNGKDGTWTFNGWTVTGDQTDTQIPQEDKKFIMPDENVTVTGTWTFEATPPTGTPVYVYFQTVNTAGKPIGDKDNENVKDVTHNENGNGWATLGKLVTATAVTTETALGNEINDNNSNFTRHDSNSGLDLSLIKSWGAPHKENGAADYVKFGTEAWHLDGKVTAYRAIYCDSDGTELEGFTPNKTPQYYLEGTADIALTSEVPDVPGKVFDGWVTNDVTVENNAFNMPGKDVTFTAKWKPGALKIEKILDDNSPAAGNTFSFTVTPEGSTTGTDTQITGAGNATIHDLLIGKYTVAENANTAAVRGYRCTTQYSTDRTHWQDTPITVSVASNDTVTVYVKNSYTPITADLIDDDITIYHKVSGRSDWHGGNAYADASAHQAGRTPTISYKAELNLSEMKLQRNKRTASIIAAYGEKPWENLVEAVKAARGSLAMFSGSKIVLHVQLDKQLSTADIQNQLKLNNITVTSDWFELSKDGDSVAYDKNAQSLTITCVPKNKADGYSSTITLSGLNDLSLTSILSSGETRTLTASGYITGSILISVPTVKVNAVTVETEDLVDAVQHGNGELYLNESIPLVLGSKTATNTAKLYWKEIKDNDDGDDDDKYFFAIQKVDAQDGHALNGAKFELYQLDKNDRIVNRRVTTTRQQSSKNGIALFGVDNKNSYEGIWYYAEVTAPEGYVLDRTEHKIKAKDFSDSLSTAVKNADTVRNYRGTTPDLLNDSDHFAYVIGYMDGNVRPYGLISRAETTTIFFRLLKDSVRDANLLTSNTYTDVPDDYWANTAISTMTGLGIVQGRSTTTFDPKAPITRAQFAAICARFDTGKSNGEQTFSDIQGHWAEKYIQRAAELGWIKGFEDGTFRPDTYITRAQAMTMINRVLNRIPEENGDLLSSMNVWPDCNPGDWFYLAVQEATNSHDYRHKAGSYETWTGLNADPDWTRYEN